SQGGHRIGEASAALATGNTAELATFLHDLDNPTGEVREYLDAWRESLSADANDQFRSAVEQLLGQPEPPAGGNTGAATAVHQPAQAPAGPAAVPLPVREPGPVAPPEGTGTVLPATSWADIRTSAPPARMETVRFDPLVRGQGGPGAIAGPGVREQYEARQLSLGGLHGADTTISYDARRFEVRPGHWVTEFTLNLHLQGPDGRPLPAHEATRMLDRVRSVVDERFNERFRLPGGDQVHLRVDGTPDAAGAHQTVTVVPGRERSDQFTWSDESPPGVLLHEALHYLGLPDEYVEPAAKPGDAFALRRRDRWAGENGVMGTSAHRDDFTVLPRHLERIEDVLRSGPVLRDLPLGQERPRPETVDAPPTQRHPETVEAPLTQRHPETEGSGALTPTGSATRAGEVATSRAPNAPAPVHESRVNVLDGGRLYHVVDVPGDGDCLLHAVLAGARELAGWQHGDLTVNGLRELASQWFRSDAGAALRHNADNTGQRPQDRLEPDERTRTWQVRRNPGDEPSTLSADQLGNLRMSDLYDMGLRNRSLWNTSFYDQAPVIIAHALGIHLVVHQGNTRAAYNSDVQGREVHVYRDPGEGLAAHYSALRPDTRAPVAVETTRPVDPQVAKELAGRVKPDMVVVTMEPGQPVFRVTDAVTLRGYLIQGKIGAVKNKEGWSQLGPGLYTGHDFGHAAAYSDTLSNLPVVMEFALSRGATGLKVENITQNWTDKEVPQTLAKYDFLTDGTQFKFHPRFYDGLLREGTQPADKQSGLRIAGLKVKEGEALWNHYRTEDFVPEFDGYLIKAHQDKAAQHPRSQDMPGPVREPDPVPMNAVLDAAPPASPGDLRRIAYREHAEAFERRLATHLLQREDVQREVKKVVDLAWAMTTGDKDKVKFGSRSTGTTGMVGTDRHLLQEVVDRGNIRERMALLYNGYTSNHFAKLVRQRQLPRPEQLTRERADRHDIGAEVVNPLTAEIKKVYGELLKGPVGESEQEAPFGSFRTDEPYGPVIDRIRDDYAQRRSEQIGDWNRKQIVEGAQKAAERRARSILETDRNPLDVNPPLGRGEWYSAVDKDGRLGWQPGAKSFHYKLGSKFQQDAHDSGGLVVSGTSGTAFGMLQAVKELARTKEGRAALADMKAEPVDFELLRLGLLGWMVESDDHTFHEIMTGSRLFSESLTPEERADPNLTRTDLAYSDTYHRYRFLAPLTEHELRTDVAPEGRFPDEHLVGDWSLDDLADPHPDPDPDPDRVPDPGGDLHRPAGAPPVPVDPVAVDLARRHLTAAAENPALREFMGRIRNGAFTSKRDDEGMLRVREGERYESLLGDVQAFLDHAQAIQPAGAQATEGSLNLYRAVRMDPQGRERDVFTELLPSSTSFDRQFVQDWMANGGGADNYALFEIHVPLSHPMLALSFPPGHARAENDPAPVNENQSEVTLGPSHLRVIAREEDGRFHVIRVDTDPMSVDDIRAEVANSSSSMSIPDAFQAFTRFFSEGSLRTAYPHDLEPYHRITESWSPDGSQKTVRIEHPHEKLTGQFLEVTISHQGESVSVLWRSSDDTPSDGGEPYVRDPLVYDATKIGDVSGSLRAQKLAEHVSFESIELPFDWYDPDVVPEAPDAPSVLDHGSDRHQPFTEGELVTHAIVGEDGVNVGRSFHTGEDFGLRRETHLNFPSERTAAENQVANPDFAPNRAVRPDGGFDWAAVHRGENKPGERDGDDADVHVPWDPKSRPYFANLHGAGSWLKVAVRTPAGTEGYKSVSYRDFGGMLNRRASLSARPEESPVVLLACEAGLSRVNLGLIADATGRTVHAMTGKTYVAKEADGSTRLVQLRRPGQDRPGFVTVHPTGKDTGGDPGTAAHRTVTETTTAHGTDENTPTVRTVIDAHDEITVLAEHGESTAPAAQDGNARPPLDGGPMRLTDHPSDVPVRMPGPDALDPFRAERAGDQLGDLRRRLADLPEGSPERRQLQREIDRTQERLRSAFTTFLDHDGSDLAAAARVREEEIEGLRTQTPAPGTWQEDHRRRQLDTLELEVRELQAELDRHALDPAVGRPDGVQGGASAPGELPTRVEDAQRQVGVLTERPPEALVEAADLLQDGAAVHHVRCDPQRPGEPRGRPFPVGRPPVGGQRHHDGALARAGAPPAGGEVGGQVGRPGRAGHRVVVQEGDPFLPDAAPAGVAGGRRAVPAARHHRDPVPEGRRDLDVQRPAVGQRPVVHQHHAFRCRAACPGECGEGDGETRPAERRDDHRVRGIGAVRHARAPDRSGPANSVPRRTTNGPRASRSIGAEPKHSKASRTSSTIGRPAVLRLVLTTTGRPVSSSNRSSIRAVSGSSTGSTLWIRAVPSTWTTAGIRSRHSGATSWTNSM
ncbi:hypothetical protein ACFVXQ_07305, partial [Kitasatospora sp. NPDC058263]